MPLEGRGGRLRRRILRRIERGADADLVLFEAETIADLATFENPYQRFKAIDSVLVGGLFVVRGREIVPGTTPGSAILATLRSNPSGG